jgi:hypothetical protein
MTVKVFKLINGEELIGEVTSDGGVGYFLDNPTTIVMQQTERGVGVALMPYMPYADKKVYVYKTAIASEATPLAEMENEYKRVTGAGIQIVPANALAGLNP